MITVEKVKNQDLIFIAPKGKRIWAFEELCRPETKRYCQLFSGMLSSLQRWNPTVALEIPLIRKATASKGRFIWSDEMQREYESIRKTMLSTWTFLAWTKAVMEVISLIKLLTLMRPIVTADRKHYLACLRL